MKLHSEVENKYFVYYSTIFVLVQREYKLIQTISNYYRYELISHFIRIDLSIDLTY